MSRTKFRMKIGNAEIEMEGEEKYIEEKFKEVFEKMIKESPKTIKYDYGSQQGTEAEREEPIETKDNLSGIMDYDVAGMPQLTYPQASKKLSLSDVITLFLYAYEPRRLTMGELQKLATRFWKPVKITALGAVMARTLKNRVVREGKRGNYRYTLAGSGRELASEIIKKLK